MSMLPEIDPRQILDAFSARKVLVSMSDGPQRAWDSKGGTYQELRWDGYLTSYLDELVNKAGQYDNVIIEWRVWPEYVAPDRIYSRFTIRPNVPVN